MEKGAYVKDIIAGSHVAGVFVVKSATLAQTRNGDPYWILALLDATGGIEARIWHPLSAGISEIPAGAFVRVEGAASVFRDRTQLVIDRFSVLADAEAEAALLSEFMPSSPYNIQEMYAELLRLVETEFQHEPWREFLGDVLRNERIRKSLCLAPAAKGIHHAYAGGLLEHTLSVARLCRLLADSYPELDRQTLLAGAILHDLGKIEELSGGLNPDYTQEGRLLGHIYLGLSLLEPFLQASRLEPWLREHLRHLVLSHHGQLEYGACRLPQTAEALALHHADNIDAKLAQCRALFADADTRPAWSGWQATLNRAILLPQATPCAAPAPPASAGAGQEFEDWTAPEEDFGPTPEEWAEIYADPAFTACGEPAAEGADAAREAESAQNAAERANRRNNQCSLL